MTKAIDPGRIETSLWVVRPIDGDVNILRQFSVDVEYHGETDVLRLGSVTGWIGWRIAGEDIHDAADAISVDAEALGAVAGVIIEDRSDLWIDSVLLIDRMYIEPAYRGNRLTGAIIADLVDLLRFEADSTLILLYPEPQRPGGGPMEDGPERDRALKRLEAAYRASGFRPWADCVVWWLPIS